MCEIPNTHVYICIYIYMYQCAYAHLYIAAQFSYSASMNLFLLPSIYPFLRAKRGSAAHEEMWLPDHACLIREVESARVLTP